MRVVVVWGQVGVWERRVRVRVRMLCGQEGVRRRQCERPRQLPKLVRAGVLARLLVPMVQVLRRICLPPLLLAWI